MHVHNYIEHWINETNKNNWGILGATAPQPPLPNWRHCLKRFVHRSCVHILLLSIYLRILYLEITFWRYAIENNKLHSSVHPCSFLRIDGVRVEEQLQLHHLQQLMHWFQSHQPPIEEHPADEFVHPSHRHQYRKPGLLTLQEFKDTLAIVLNTRSFDNQLDNLFAKVTHFKD